MFRQPLRGCLTIVKMILLDQIIGWEKRGSRIGGERKLSNGSVDSEGTSKNGDYIICPMFHWRRV